jgi:hypothetical protein
VVTGCSRDRHEVKLLVYITWLQALNTNQQQQSCRMEAAQRPITAKANLHPGQLSLLLSLLPLDLVGLVVLALICVGVLVLVVVLVWLPDTVAATVLHWCWCWCCCWCCCCCGCSFHRHLGSEHACWHLG